MEIDHIFIDILAVFSSAAAIYQLALLKEREKSHRKYQYLLASVGNISLQKMQKWTTQISGIPSEPNSYDTLFVLRTLHNAKDDIAEIQSMVSALEGTICSDFSATTELLKKNIEDSKLNNKLQEIGLQNPTRSENLK